MSDSNQIAARGKVSSIILKDIDISINELKLMDDCRLPEICPMLEVIYLSFWGQNRTESFNFQRGTGAVIEKNSRDSACSKCKIRFKNGKMAVEPKERRSAETIRWLIS